MADKTTDSSQRVKGTGLDFYNTSEAQLKEIVNDQAEGGSIDNDDLMRLVVAGTEREEAADEEVSFKVNGVALEMEDGTVLGSRIPLFDGAILDLTTVTLDLIEGNDGKKEAEDSGSMGARLVLAPANSKFIQQFPVTDIVLKDDDGKEAGEPSVQGKTAADFAFPFENGDIFMAKQGSFDDHLFKSDGSGRIIRSTGKSEEKEVVIDESGVRLGASSEINEIVNAKRSAAEAGTIQPITEDSDVERVSDAPEKKVFIPAVEKTFEKELFNSENDEDEDENEDEGDKSLTDTIKDEAKERAVALAKTVGKKGADIAKGAFAKATEDLSAEKLLNDPKGTIRKFKDSLASEFKEGVSEAIDNAPAELLDAVSKEVWDAVEGVEKKLNLALEILNYASIYIGAAKKIGINTDPITRAIENCISAISNFSDGLKERLNSVIPKGEDEEEPEDGKDGDDDKDEDDKRITIEVPVFPGFDIEFFLEPSYRLSFGGSLKLDEVSEGQDINLTLGVNAAGHLGLKVGVGAKAGNDLFALIAEVSGEARVIGIMENERFAALDLKNINFGKMTKDGPELIEPKFEGADFKIGAEVVGTLEGLIQAKSEVFDWDRDLLHGSLQATLASATMEGSATKEGKLFSLSGWKLNNLSITTAFLDQNKSDLMKLSFAEHTIERAEELTELSDDDLAKLDALDEKMGNLQKLLQNSSKGEKDLAVGFSNNEDSIAERAPRLFDQIKNGYMAIFIKLDEDARVIGKEITSFLETSEAQNVDYAVEQGIMRHSGRLSEMEAWYQGGPERSREEVLRSYRGLAAGKFKNEFNINTGYEREDIANTEKEAEDELYNKEEILSYEQGKIEEYSEKRQEKFNRLMELYSDYKKNPKNPESFLKAYASLYGKDSDKSLLDNIAKFGVELGLFESEATAIEALYNYELNRFSDNTADFTKKLESLNHMVAELAKEGKDTKFNADFNKAYKKADEELWTSFVAAHSDETDKENVEMVRMSESDSKNLQRVALLMTLRRNDREYKNAMDEDKKEAILTASKSQFETLLRKTKYKGKQTEWDDFMSAENRYKRMSASDIEETAKAFVDENDYFSWKGAEKEDQAYFNAVQTISSGNVADISALYRSNKKIQAAYKDYLNNAKTDIEGSLSLWDIDEMDKYEFEIAQVEIGNQGDRYFKHYERHVFLDSAKRKLGIVKEGEYFDANAEKAEVIRHYFNGTRPEYAAEVKGAEGEPVEPGPAKEYADKYLNELMKNRDSLNFFDEKVRQRLIEAVRHKLDPGREKRKSALEVLEALPEEKKKDPRAAMEAWKKAGGNIDFLNHMRSGDDFTIHDMISYLEFKIGRTANPLSGEEFTDYALENAMAGRSDEFSPRNMMAFARQYRESMDKKHADRIKLINEARGGSDGKATMTYEELLKKYNELESSDGGGIVEKGKKQFRKLFGISHMTGYNQSLKENTAIRGRITPEMIMNFEVRRITEGNEKHRKRLEAVNKAAAEDARSVYTSAELGGGAGFYESIRDRIKETAGEKRMNRTGAEEMERIRSYEQSKMKKYEDMKASAMKDKDDLQAKRNEIYKRLNESNDVIKAAEGSIKILRERPKTMAEYKQLPVVAEVFGKVRESLRSVQMNKDAMKGLRDRLTQAAASRNQMASELGKNTG